MILSRRLPLHSGSTSALCRSLWSWGIADCGRLGAGHDPYDPALRKCYPKPLFISSFDPKQISCGAAHSIAVTKSGKAAVCGLGEDGQLGLGDFESLGIFFEIPEIEGVIQVAAAHRHSVILCRDGSVYAFGKGSGGELGTEVRKNKRNYPVLVSRLQELGVKVVQIACGSNHTLALTDAGEVYSWGLNTQGCLGHTAEKLVSLPTRISQLKGVIDIKAGYYNSAAITADRRVFIWGNGFDGQIGNREKTHAMATPTIVHALTGIEMQQLSFGHSHIVACSKYGQMYIWGDSLHHQLGIPGTKISALEPIIHEKMTQIGVQDVAGGVDCTVALSKTGDLWVWGYGDGGRLGAGNEYNHFEPFLALPSQRLKSVSLGWEFGMAI